METGATAEGVQEAQMQNYTPPNPLHTVRSKYEVVLHNTSVLSCEHTKKKHSKKYTIADKYPLLLTAIATLLNVQTSFMCSGDAHDPVKDNIESRRPLLKFGGGGAPHQVSRTPCSCRPVLCVHSTCIIRPGVVKLNKSLL